MAAKEQGTAAPTGGRAGSGSRRSTTEQASRGTTSGAKGAGRAPAKRTTTPRSGTPGSTTPKATGKPRTKPTAAARKPEAPAAPAVSPATAESQRRHRSAVETLLAPHPGDAPAPAPAPAPQPARAGRAGAAAPTPELADATRALLSSALLVPGEHTGHQPTQVARHAAAGEPAADVVRLDPRTGLPPAQDVALGAAAIVAERLWQAGSAALAWGHGAVAWSVGFARAVSPQVASTQADAGLQRLAARGQQVRLERSEALTTSMTAGIMAAATSDAVREMVVAAIEEATDDVLDVVLPAMLEAITERETQDKLDELMAGLLLRQLPAALEKTIPQVMLRTATRPAAGLMPFLGGVLPR
ncbi:MAG: hypothetical protein MUD13_09455 [Candidatus Nanopelagicales bacterium]|jgi:hypothetical protein|nr:hypothetical protein [Candidatus Nanopelagicales bacterium]